MTSIKFETGISYNEKREPIFKGTPFLECTSPLNENALWMRWGNYMVVDTYSDLEIELNAIRNNVAMGDMSPLAKYRISGPDSENYLNGLIPRNINKMKINQVYFSPWCNKEGLMVGDGLIIRESATSFIISSDPGLKWWTSNAIGFDVSITDQTDNYGILTIQGPKSKETISNTTNKQVINLPFSQCKKFNLEGHEILVMRQGFTGEHGYEIWAPRELGLKIWKIVEEAGKEFNILPAGAWALDISRIEAGLLIPGYDYTGAGPEEEMGGAGIYASSEFVASPFELKLGQFIDFSSGRFIGFDRLADMANLEGRKQLVGLEINWQELSNSEPNNLRRVKWYPVRAFQNGTSIGYVTSIVWSPTLKKLIGFGHLNFDTNTNEEITLLWENDKELKASICSLPFYKNKRTN